MPDRRTPFGNVGEKEMLVAFLDYLRESIIFKLEGLDDETARRPMVESGTSLMWLAKHLTRVEWSWFDRVFDGKTTKDDPRPAKDLEPIDTVESVVAGYRAAIARSNEIVDACGDLDRVAANDQVGEVPPSLRWILVHMVEETARHAGHADILREQIDGSTGR